VVVGFFFPRNLVFLILQVHVFSTLVISTTVLSVLVITTKFVPFTPVQVMIYVLLWTEQY